MTLSAWLLYAAAVFVLTVTPGPSVLLCVTHGVHQGARRALFAAFGSVSAVLVIMLLSMLGLGAALAASESLFVALKWAGAAYLFWLGLKTFRSPADSFQAAASSGPPLRRRALYLQGLAVGASNPKALLFFGALFPQFIDLAAPRLPQFLLMGATFVVFELFWLGFYAHFAARLAPWLAGRGRARWFNRASGAVFMGAAALLALVRRAPAA